MLDTVIPLIAVPNQEMFIVLAQQNCTIRLIQRHKRMYLSLWLNDNDEVFSGMLCRDRLPLLQSRAQKFYGNLVFVDLEGTQDPQYNGLGSRWILFYYPPDEILLGEFQQRILDLEGV